MTQDTDSGGLRPLAVLITSNAYSLANFRGPLIRDIIARGWRVHALAPDYDEKTRARMIALGAEPVEITLERTTIRPLRDIVDTVRLALLMRRLKPQLVLSYFIKPVIFTVLPFFWIMTGLVSLTTGFRNGVELMISTGAGALSGPAVIAGALADIAVGTLMVWRPTSRLGLQGAIALSAFYLIAGSVLRPDLWNEPLGPLLKILPILVLHFVAMAILDER